MKMQRLFVMAASIAALTLFTGGTAAGQSSYRVIGYFSSWGIYERHFMVTDIAAEMLTHINYAFFNVSESGECVLGDPWADTQFPYPGDKDGEPLLGNFKQLQLLKKAHPTLQTLMSVGGWTWSGRFSDVALTDDSRQKFAQSCVSMMMQYGFNGIDIDWEYPDGGGLDGNKVRAEDPANYVLLLTELRKQLDDQGTKDGQHYLLTIAGSAGTSHISHTDLSAVAAQVDWINVMAYDFNGSWSARTGFNAPLYAAKGDTDPTGNGDFAIQAYLRAGVPADQVVLGVPFYGRGWKGVKNTNNGLFQPYTDIPGEEGSFDYFALDQAFIPYMPRFWDDTAKVPWLYFDKTGIMISYDDPQSLEVKADYVKQNNLGGVMIWELAGDSRDHTLLKALNEGLK